MMLLALGVDFYSHASTKSSTTHRKYFWAEFHGTSANNRWYKFSSNLDQSSKNISHKFPKSPLLFIWFCFFILWTELNGQARKIKPLNQKDMFTSYLSRKNRYANCWMLAQFKMEMMPIREIIISKYRQNASKPKRYVMKWIWIQFAHCSGLK